jgi:uncharacterized protein YdcH (DUF465 family)
MRLQRADYSTEASFLRKSVRDSYFPNLSVDFDTEPPLPAVLKILSRREEKNLKEQEIVDSLARENAEFKKLMDEHHSLEDMLSEIDKKVYLTAEEEIERKKLQKQKLLRKDKMAELIRDFRKSHILN